MTTDEKLDLMIDKISDIQAEVSGIKAEVSGIKAEVSEIKADLSEVKQKVTAIELTLENEIRVNILRVAEGHSDLVRNISDTKRDVGLLESKMEINDLYIRYHDSEIKKLNLG